MAARDDGKTRALAASRTLNPHPEKVTDPAFGPGGFFDPADLVQVKYEMVRAAETGQLPAGEAAAAFGFSRQSLYTAKAALHEEGLAAPDPRQTGSQKRTQAHRGSRQPPRGAAGSRSAATAGGAGRRGRAAFRHHGASAFGGTGAAAAPESPERRRAGRPAGPQKLTPPRGPRHRRGQRTWSRAMSSCATSRPAATPAAGVMAWACWWPRAWPAGWPRAPPCRRPRPSTAALPQRRHRRPARPCPPSTRRCPHRTRKEVPARRPARRCCPPPSFPRSSRCWHR